MAGLRNGFLIALLTIYIVLATIFQSYLQPLIIMIIIPFGIVGALLAHPLLGHPVSFSSLFGIIALSGVLVNDSIVLIARINSNVAEGIPLQEAVVQGAKRRFRAIFLTSLSIAILSSKKDRSLMERLTTQKEDFKIEIPIGDTDPITGFGPVDPEKNAEQNPRGDPQGTGVEETPFSN